MILVNFMYYNEISQILQTLETHLNKLDRSTSHSSVGILLWGAPGSGKSTSARELASTYDPLYIINIDTITETLLYVLSKSDYQKLKDNIISGDQSTELFYKVRKTTFRDASISTHDAFNYLFRNAVFSKDTLRQIQPITQSEVRSFTSMNRDQRIVSAFESFIIFLAKRRGHNFMKETTGNAFKIQWTREVYSNVKSLLQVIFVSSVDLLETRVKERIQMFNIDPKDIAPIYDTSYFSNFYIAVKMFMFENILVISNDTSEAKTLIKLTKNDSKRGYTITVNPPNVLNPNEYKFMHGILINIGITESQIPDHISRQPLSAYFCCDTFSWNMLN